jgi:hypothetical protein
VGKRRLVLERVGSSRPPVRGRGFRHPDRPSATLDLTVTMNIYMDPALLDVARALEALPQCRWRPPARPCAYAANSAALACQ